jgi:multidrug transporter EmrE-like cation transporter
MNHGADGQYAGRDTAKMLLGMAIGLALGLAVGLALDNIAIGAGMGIAIGTALGVAFSGRRREPSRPLTILGVVLLLVGIVVLAIIMSLVEPQWWCDYPVLNLIPGC